MTRYYTIFSYFVGELASCMSIDYLLWTKKRLLKNSFFRSLNVHK